MRLAIVIVQSQSGHTSCQTTITCLPLSTSGHISLYFSDWQLHHEIM